MTGTFKMFRDFVVLMIVWYYW